MGSSIEMLIEGMYYRWRSVDFLAIWISSSYDLQF